MFKTMLNNRITRDFIWSGIFIFSMYALTHNPIIRPTPRPISGDWSIQFMQHPLLFGFAGHNYLALHDPNGNIVAELHGLATDPITGNWKYIGSNPSDILRVWEFKSSKYYLAGKTFPGIILQEGTQSDIEKTWTMGQSCENPINTKNIPYPPYGFSLKNETTNSNSVAYTLANCMGLVVRHVGLFTPGDAMNLLDSR